MLLPADYYSHVTKLNQLLVLSQQLEEDIRHLGSHKYIAHQLSVIYVRTIHLYRASTSLSSFCCAFGHVSCSFLSVCSCSKSSALSEAFRLFPK